MRTIKTTVYKLSELTESAQEKAIEKLYDINVDRDWWDCTYDDAKTIGLVIDSFDTDRASYCNGSLTVSVHQSASLIMANHGKDCDTYKLAEKYIDTDMDADDYEDIEKEYSRALCEEYLSMLRREYEYLTSKEAIIETINANEYEFEEGGTLA